jgi:23S rRNA (uracil1939-C5)-methyltransferase
MSTDARPEITLTGVAHGGEAVGRAGDLVAFIGLGLPGERVAAEIVERKPRYVRGRVAEVHEASPVRVTPPCPIFGTCGGCHWQHATYAAQLAFKTQVLRDQLVRVGRFADPPVEEAVPSPQEWHYRNTVQFVPGSLDASGRPVASGSRAAAAGRLLCFQRAHSHAPVPVEHCYISDELINRTIHDAAWEELDDRTWRGLEAIQVRVVPGSAVQITLAGRRAPSRDSVRRFVEATRRRLPQLAGVLAAQGRGATTSCLWGDESLAYQVVGYRLAVPASAFVQVNVGLVERIAARLLAWLAPAAGDVVLDAYAGAGTFALPLAARAGSAIAIEAHPASAGAAARNAAQAGLTNLAVQALPVEEGLRRLEGRVDLTVLDPPRRGCSEHALGALLRLRPRKIAYVSCEPSTLARDLRHLAAGSYDLVASGVFDMFPQTYHLESLSLLKVR